MLKQFLFEEGPDDADLTTANTGAALIVKNGGTAKFSTATKSSGSFGGRWVMSAGNCISRYELNAANARMGFSGVVTMPAGSGTVGSTVPFAVLDSAGAAVFTLDIRNTALLQVANMVPTVGETYRLTTDGSTGAENQITVQGGSKYKLEVVAKTGATTGTLDVKLFTEKGTVPVGYFTRSGINMGTTDFKYVHVGLQSGGASGFDCGWDNLQLDDGATVAPAPLADALPAPVVTLVPTNPTVAGGTGTVVATWPAVPGAATYQSCIVPGNVATGFVSTREDPTRTRTFTVPAGQHTVAVRAMP